MIKNEAVKDLGDYGFAFGALMNIAVKLDTLMDKELKAFDLTSKQWYLLMVLNSLFAEPPTLKQAAKKSGSSYQNIKQIALKLETKGLLIIEKDPHDSRALRLVMTEEARKTFQTLEPTANNFLSRFFNRVSPEEIKIVAAIMLQLLNNCDDMEA